MYIAYQPNFFRRPVACVFAAGSIFAFATSHLTRVTLRYECGKGLIAAIYVHTISLVFLFYELYYFSERIIFFSQINQ
jgi:hypothetical protein